jgi:hypothetical protein
MSFRATIAKAVAVAQSVAGETVVYKRPSMGQSVSINARRARTRIESVDSEGVAIRGHVVDWIVGASDLLLGGQKIKPTRGDRLIVVTETETQTFEVREIGGEKESAFHDPDGVYLRIHCRLMLRAATED